MDPIASPSTATAGPAAGPASTNTPAAVAGLTKPNNMSTDSSLKPPRTLVLCFDGTSNQYDGTNTNVVKFYSLLRKDNTGEQLCYYQPGVGTYIEPGVVSPLFQWCAKIADEAVAWYLDAHVRGGYQFLMQNWRPKDKICIFGFSRGAYTARALAGFIHKIGLLPRDNPEQVPLAYKLYKRTDKASVELAAGFKRTFCRDVKIEFVGVWETVSSVGILRSKTLPFTTSNTTIKIFRHALALDEHRAKFRPNLYHRSPPPDAPAAPKKVERPASPVVASPTSMHTAESTDALKQPPGADKAKYSEKARLFSRGNLKRVQTKPSRKRLFVGRNMNRILRREEPTNLTDPSDDNVGVTDVKEVWFAGCHSDVGGGAVPNSTQHCLGDISLQWMVHEVVASQCGIQFDSDALARANISDSVIADQFHTKEKQLPLSAFLPKQHPKELEVEDEAASKMGSDESADPTTDDALQPIHDEMQINKAWWLLEVVPTDYSWQDGKGVWHTKWSFHLGKGRRIPSDVNPEFHESVKQRMEYAPLNYKPRATWKAGTETYVP